MTTKQEELTRKILTALNKIFSDESEEYYIDVAKEFAAGGRFDYTDFFIALGAAVPTHIYNRLTQAGEGMLQVNHIINGLILELAVKEAEQNVRLVPTGDPVSNNPDNWAGGPEKTWQAKIGPNVFDSGGYPDEDEVNR